MAHTPNAPYSPAQQARNALAHACRRDDPPEVIAGLRQALDDAKAQMKADAQCGKLAAHIRRVVDGWPQVRNADRRARLALAMHPGAAGNGQES